MSHHHHSHAPPHGHERNGTDQDASTELKRPVFAHRDAADLILFLDAFSGLSGDMLVAALVDLGVPFHVVEESLGALGLVGYRASLQTISSRSGIRAQRFEVVVSDEQPMRTYAAIRALLDAAPLRMGVRERAQAAFLCLAEAESAVHGVPVADVHFHEVGAVDSIVDIVAAVACFDHLGARVVCSPLPMGRGFIRTMHGQLPLPAPATLLCLRGVPTYDAGVEGELVTPTGACLVKTMAASFERWPAIRPERVGWGAGARDVPDRPNVLRAVLGTCHGAALLGPGFVVLEANVDDQTPEQVAYAMEALRSSGALDVWQVPIGMKKGRHAVMVCALARTCDVDIVSRTMLAETSSLGLRLRAVDRIERPRTVIEVATRLGPVRVKVAAGDALPTHYAPEFDDCQRLAQQSGEPIKRIYEEAMAAALAQHIE